MQNTSLLNQVFQWKVILPMLVLVGAAIAGQGLHTAERLKPPAPASIEPAEPLENIAEAAEITGETRAPVAISLSGATAVAASASVRTEDGAATVTTPSGLGDYGAIVPLDTADMGSDAFDIDIALSVQDGSVGLVLVRADDANDWLGEEQCAAARDGDQAVKLRMTGPLGNSAVLIRNCSPDGVSEATIHAVSVTAH